MPSLDELDAISVANIQRFAATVGPERRAGLLARFWATVRLWQVKASSPEALGDVAITLMVEREAAHHFTLEARRGRLRCDHHPRGCRELEFAAAALLSMVPPDDEAADRDPTAPPLSPEALRDWARPLGLAHALSLRWDLAFGVQGRQWSQDFRTLEAVLTQPPKAQRRSYDPDPVELRARLQARAWRAVTHRARVEALPGGPADDLGAVRAWDMLRPALIPGAAGWAPLEGWVRVLHDGRTASMVNHAPNAGETTSTQLSLASGQPVFTCRCGRRDGTCPDCQGLVLAVLERLASPQPDAAPFWRLGEREADRSVAALRALIEAPRQNSAPVRHFWSIAQEGPAAYRVGLAIAAERSSRTRPAGPGDLEQVLPQIELDAELRLLELFRHQQNGGGVPTDELLLCLPGLDNLTDGRGEALRVELQPVEVELRLVEGEALRPQLRLGPDLLNQNDVQRAISSPSNRLIQLSRPGLLTLARLAPGGKAALRALMTGQDIPPDLAPTTVALLSALDGRLPMRLDPALRGNEVKPDCRPILRLQSLGSQGALARLLMRPVPGGPLLEPGQPPGEAYGHGADGQRLWATRDLAAEQAAAERARAHLPPFSDDQPLSNEVVIVALDGLSGENGAPELNPDDPTALRVEWAGRPRRLSRPARPSDTRLSVRPHHDWLGLAGGVEVDGLSLDIDELLAAVLAGSRFVALESGDIVRLSDELRRALAPAAAAASERDGERGLPSVAAATLLTAADAGATLDAGDFQADWERRIAALTESRTAPPPLPDGLQATLRPYQVAGLSWLLRMAGWSPGCVLADDMGLGKTLQAIGLLLHHAENGPQLVIAPTSVCDNWAEECARFAPSLRVRTYREKGRQELLEDLDENDVLIASYDIVQRDIEALSEHGWATLVLDEAQAIKNSGTGRARAIAQLPADFTLLLSGTPVENHLGELWSLMQRAVPGLLGSYESFRARFQLPVESHRDHERRDALAALVRPFILRRRKADVAPELPPRTVTTERVPLSALEWRTYARMREAMISRVAGAGEGQRFEVLSAILRLRQLSNAVQLIDPESQLPSAKLDRAVELLSELWAEGQATLVFSQFTSLLKLMAPRLRDAGLPYLYLDGSTPATERSQLVRRFQGGEGAVFLLSLKAGGTGLNLTRASSVIHLDPWWNPAVEDQATDRAHRIGQKQPVTVVRLVAAGTIEEQILELHATKRELVDGVLAGADGGQSLSVRELCALLTAAGPAA